MLEPMTDYRQTPQAKGPLVTGFNGRLFGLERDTGEIRWERSIPGGAPPRIAIAAGRVYATGYRLHCIDYETGEEYWTAAFRYHGTRQIIVEGDAIFVTSHGELECFSLTGESLWSNGFKGKGYGTMALGFEGNIAQADVNT